MATSIPVGGLTLPAAAVPAAVAVLVYSFICLSFGILLVTVLLITKERGTYVLLTAITTTLSTVVAIAQQIYYIAHWRASRIDSYQGSVAAALNPILSLRSTSTGFTRVSFWIQVYLFDTDAMLLSFWAVALTVNIWNWRSKWIQQYHVTIQHASKVTAFLLPAIATILRATVVVQMPFAAAIFVTSFLLFIGLTLGAACLFLILLKYILTRLHVRTYTDNSYANTNPSTGSRNRKTRSRSGVHIDSWLIVRFSLAFVMLAAFNIVLIDYNIRRWHSIQMQGAEPAPDFSIHATLSDILGYISPVSASLLAFCLFGTSAQARAKYRSFFCMHKRKTLSVAPHGSGTDDWDPLTDKNATREDLSSMRDPYELEDAHFPPRIPPKDPIVVTSDVYVTRTGGNAERSFYDSA